MTPENAPSTDGKVKTSYGKDGQRVPKGPKRASQSQPSNERSYLERRIRDPYQGRGAKQKQMEVGIMERLIQGRDGVIRGAQLRAGMTHIERPL